MSETLNQLLAIQGAAEQQTMGALINGPRWPQMAPGARGASGLDEIHSEPEKPLEGPPGPEKRDPPPSPARAEIKQIFSIQESALLCELYKSGRMELLDKLHVFRSSGAVYAHFLLTLDDPPETGKGEKSEPIKRAIQEEPESGDGLQPG